MPVRLERRVERLEERVAGADDEGRRELQRLLARLTDEDLDRLEGVVVRWNQGGDTEALEEIERLLAAYEDPGGG